jgi:hypothetical protein
MPLEGHYGRVNTPLRKLTRRERNVAIAMIVATTVAIVVLIAATVGNDHQAVGAGCIHVPVPGRTGGELVSGCGTEAQALCARASRYEGRRAELVLAACAEARIKP